MASLVRLRRDRQSATLRTRSEGNLLPQHRVMLPLEQALENYMFLLVAGFAVRIDIPVHTRCSNESISVQHRSMDLALALI